MGETNFNRRQCIRALIKLGFTLSNKRFGIHDKLVAPFPANPPFIMIPRHKELHCQQAILKELRKMGGDELIKKFLENL